MSGVNDETNSPTSIEDAFRMLRQNDKQAAAPTMGDGNMGEGEGSGSQPGSEAISQEGEEKGQSGTVDGQESGELSEGDIPAGGSATPGEGTGEVDNVLNEQPDDQAIDYGDVSKHYIESTQRLAIDTVNKLFRDNDVTKVSINDLYEKDDHGRVSFKNPDDPDRPFASRAEAQQWCEAFNAQVDSEWKRMVQDQQRAYMKDIQPMLRLMSFAPEFDAMSAQEQKVFDSVVEPYAIKDKSGMVVGYSCDLGNAKQVALNICKSMGVKDDQQDPVPAGNDAGQQSIQGGGPALDAQTSGTGNPQNDNDEPKNLNDAVKKLMEAKKKERNNG